MYEGLEGQRLASFLRDWDRILLAANRPETTRYHHLLAAAQLAKYLAVDHRTRPRTMRRRIRPW